MAETVGAYVLKRLHEHGVDRIYGYPGDGINGVLGGFHEHGEDVQFVQTRHEEIASWRDAAKAMKIPYDEELGVHPQADNFTKHDRWDFADTGPDGYPLLLHYPYFDLYRKQVVKQADLVMAMLVRGEAFSAEEKARNFAYYEPLTVRDSSLSACVQAVLA
ncbi:hypothetical protein J0H33_13010, partial [bacterium]|nr:hypothetical protein [bacterium]